MTGFRVEPWFFLIYVGTVLVIGWKKSFICWIFCSSSSKDQISLLVISDIDLHFSLTHSHTLAALGKFLAFNQYLCAEKEIVAITATSN